jgi:hypothetical protein
VTYGTELPPSVLLALATGRIEIARNSLFKIVKADPTNTFGWLCLAVTLPREQAIQALQRVLILDPENPVALRNLVRLRQSSDPDIALELDDVLQSDPLEEEAPTLFGNEQPTLNLRQPATEANLGQETPTLLDLTHAYANLTSQLKAIKQLPPLPDEASTEQAKPAKMVKTEVIPPAKLEVNHPAKITKPEIIPPAKVEIIPPARQEEPLAIGNSVATVLANPEPAFKNAGPARHEENPKPSAEKKPPIPAVPLHMARLAAIPLNLKDSSSIVSAELVSGRLSTVGAADSGDNFKPKPFMPRLNNGPRPTLGMAPRPVLGFTTFGFLVTLIMILLIIFCLVLLVSGGGTAAIPMEIPTPTQ